MLPPGVSRLFACHTRLTLHYFEFSGRYINHACQPNCEMKLWAVDGKPRMALFTLRDIAVGEEITYNYGFKLFNPLCAKVKMLPSSCSLHDLLRLLILLRVLISSFTFSGACAAAPTVVDLLGNSTWR